MKKHEKSKKKRKWKALGIRWGPKGGETKIKANDGSGFQIEKNY